MIFQKPTKVIGYSYNKRRKEGGADNEQVKHDVLLLQLYGMSNAELPGK